MFLTLEMDLFEESYFSPHNGWYSEIGMTDHLDLRGQGLTEFPDSAAQARYSVINLEVGGCPLRFSLPFLLFRTLTPSSGLLAGKRNPGNPSVH